MSNVPRIHRGLGFLVLGLAVLQYFLAGLGVFGGGLGSDDYEAHRIVGTLLSLLALVLLVLAAIGRREALQTSAALFVLMILQTVLGISGQDAKVLGALHPLNGLLILFMAHQTARGLGLPGRGRHAAT